jgi:FtsP/CotA-like multicopper oxidase with cupredoxin domain
MRLALSSGQPLIQIGTDWGLLEAPVASRSIPLSMAERVEVIIDFGVYPVGTRVVLRNLRHSGEMGEIMRFDVTRSAERGEEARVAIRFDSYRGRYLLHCHNLEHEDHAMMARFNVV